MSTTSAALPAGAERRLRCSRCGEAFACGRDAAQGCWCAALPALPRSAYDDAADCLCATCLRQAVAESTKSDGAP